MVTGHFDALPIIFKIEIVFESVANLVKIFIVKCATQMSTLTDNYKIEIPNYFNSVCFRLGTRQWLEERISALFSSLGAQLVKAQFFDRGYFRLF